MKNLVFFLAVLIVLPVFQGCETDDKETPPDIPPVETMVMNLDIFNSEEDATALNLQDYIRSTEVSEETLTTKNFGYAALTVVFWQLILAGNLAIPVASFGATVNQEAEFIGDATWQWQYNFQSEGVYTARLTGEVRSEEIKWEMYISKEGVGAFDEVKWYEGTSALSGNSGEWILYQNPTDPVELLQIEWQKTGDEVGSIKYKYIKEENSLGEDDPVYGSYIRYGLVDAEYDAFYQVHIYNANTTEFQDTDIEVNTTDSNGRIIAERIYSDDKWHCWNSEGQDVDCDE